MGPIRSDVNSIDDVRQSLAALNRLLGNMRIGTGVFVAGSCTITDARVAAGSLILVGGSAPNTAGAPYLYSKTAGTGFVVKSTNAGDVGTFAYLIIDP